MHCLCRLDIVWDEHFPDSLKIETCAKRGKEFAGTLSHPVPLLENGRSFFLHIDANKVELFSFLATQLMSLKTAMILKFCVITSKT